MALDHEFKNVPVLSRLQNGTDLYYLKDAELRAFVNTFGNAALRDVAENYDQASDADKLITAAQLLAAVKDLAGAMHFLGVSTTDPKTGVVTIDGKVVTGEAGDVVLYGTKEYIASTSGSSVTWSEIGDEGLWVPNTRTVAELPLTADITVAQLRTKLGLGDMAYANSASGTSTTSFLTAINDITVAKAGEYAVSGTAVTVPQTYKSLDVTPNGDVEISQTTDAAVTYDKLASINVSGATATEGQTANYIPAGSVTINRISVTPSKDDVATVKDAGTAYTISDGGVSKAEDTTSTFAKAGVTASVGSGDNAETLILTAATTSDAVTAVGAITYTKQTLSGALPTFGTKNVVTGITGATGEASFSGKGAVITATPASFSTEDANVTQPVFTADFTGSSKSVTPEALTTASVAPSDAKVTVASETKQITGTSSAVSITVTRNA